MIYFGLTWKTESVAKLFENRNKFQAEDLEFNFREGISGKTKKINIQQKIRYMDLEFIYLGWNSQLQGCFPGG